MKKQNCTEANYQQNKDIKSNEDPPIQDGKDIQVNNDLDELDEESISDTLDRHNYENLKNKFIQPKEEDSLKVTKYFFRDLNIFQPQVHPSQRSIALIQKLDEIYKSKGVGNQLPEDGYVSLYIEIQNLLKRFRDIGVIMRKWNLMSHLDQDQEIQNCELVDALDVIDLDQINELIRVINNGLEYDNNGIYVKRGMFKELDSLWVIYDQLDELMEQKTYDLVDDVRDMPEFMHQLRIMMIPSCGYFTSIKTEVYFQNSVTYSLDRDIGDIFTDIQNVEFCIISSVQQEIIDYQKQLMLINQFMSVLDAYVAAYMTVIEFKLIPPAFVQRTITIVCGQNGSGKSVFLKNLGSVIYLAQIGMYVPCEEAELIVFDKVLTKIRVSEDNTKFQYSFFFNEALMMKQIIDDSDGNTLLLIDEYGRGTNHFTGMSSLLTLIEILTDLKMFKQVKTLDNKIKNLPTTFFSTNMVELFDQKPLVENLSKFPNFKLLVIDEDNKEAKECRIMNEKIGRFLQPFQCAERTRMNKRVVERAKQIQKGLGEHKKIQGNLVVEAWLDEQIQDAFKFILNGEQKSDEIVFDYQL
ncbi:msh5-like protein [Stylonychia lemnae]|uniref:Msh5-like protein n=1 Tax=Stylonychia lemnae TaxID=5949 RepID=A0A078BCT7_STYLE|nr:msh5-like protein [Stylonychia lemnae]|eukprot:CDW91398.1 msh5-like protein [Stylonychia lemnae]